MTREEIYAWMDKQIEAVKICNTPLCKDDPFYVCVAGYYGDKTVHIYNIDNLCEELGQKWKFEPHDDEFNSHYFMYKGYKFFGLIEKRENDERK